MMKLTSCVLGFGMVVFSLGSVLANDVRVLREGALIKIVGDQAGNSIQIEQTANGLRVTGRSGTTVNRSSSALLAGRDWNAMEIRMEGGNDFVTVRGLVLGNDLFADLGGGNDRIEVLAGTSVGNNCFIEGGTGNDTITCRDTSVWEDLAVSGGLGALTASFSQMNIGKQLTVISDGAADIIDVTSSVIADFVNIDCKAGNDRVTLINSMSFGIYVASDLGADRITLQNWWTTEDIGLFTGTGNDQVTLQSVLSGKSLTLSLDAGDDTVVATNVDVAEDAVLEGGSGVDAVTDRGIRGGTKKEIKEFERFLR